MNQPVWKQGDRVRIPKGTPFVHATSPRMTDLPTETKATHTVKVHNVSGPYSDNENAWLWWAGPGGYWRVVEITHALIAANESDL